MAKKKTVKAKTWSYKWKALSLASRPNKSNVVAK